jgi:hypothetical protein
MLSLFRLQSASRKDDFLMKILYTSLLLETAAPLHHGYTDSVEMPGSSKDNKEKYRLVRQVKLLLPVTRNDEGEDAEKHGTGYQAVTVPILGGNALRGRLRRAAFYLTLEALGLTPHDFVAHGKKAFHTLSSGGAMGSGEKRDAIWADHADYRQQQLDRWPLLTLFGGTIFSAPIPGKLRVGISWPLVEDLKPVIHTEAVQQYHLYPRYRNTSTRDLILGGTRHIETTNETRLTVGDLYFEYKHADNQIVPMPDAGSKSQRAQELSAVPLAYQYVPAGVIFGSVLAGINLTELEQSLLAATLEYGFPDQETIVFGSRTNAGLGLMRVVDRPGFHQLPSADLYYTYLHDHREALRNEVTHDTLFLVDVVEYNKRKSKSKASAKAEDQSPHSSPPSSPDDTAEDPTEETEDDAMASSS